MSLLGLVMWLDGFQGFFAQTFDYNLTDVASFLHVIHDKTLILRQCKSLCPQAFAQFVSVVKVQVFSQVDADPPLPPPLPLIWSSLQAFANRAPFWLASWMSSTANARFDGLLILPRRPPKSLGPFPSFVVRFHSSQTSPSRLKTYLDCPTCRLLSISRRCHTSCACFLAPLVQRHF